MPRHGSRPRALPAASRIGHERHGRHQGVHVLFAGVAGEAGAHAGGRAQRAVQRLAQARGDFLSKLCKGVTQEEFAAFFSMVGKMVDNLGDMPLEDELRLENEFEKGSVKGQ